jgi:hypothetical protein
MLLAGTCGPGDKVVVDASDGELSFEVEAGGASLTEEEAELAATAEPAQS